MANDGKYTVEQLGQLAKQKYPDKYQLMGDAVAGEAVLKEYPQYKSYLVDGSPQSVPEQSKANSYTIQQLGQLVKTKYPKKYGSMKDSVAGAKLISEYPQYGSYLKKKEPTAPIGGIPAYGSAQELSQESSNLHLFNSPLNSNLPESQNPAAQWNAYTPEEQSINGSLKVSNTASMSAEKAKPISPIESLNGWMTHSLGDVTKNASLAYPVVSKPQKLELIKQRATLRGQAENPVNQQQIANIDNTLSLYSPEGQKIQQDLQKSVGENNMSWFITPQQQVETKQRLLAKYGVENENVIDNVINFFNTTNKRKSFYDTGKTLDKQEGITDKEQEANYNMAVNEIFSDKEAQAEEQYSKIKQQMTSPNPDKEEINQAHGKLNSLGYNVANWKEYNPGYRIVKKDETPTGYDNMVNNLVNHYIKKPDSILQKISKQNYVIKKALQAKMNQLEPVIQQINENKLNSMLPKEYAKPLKPINISSLTGTDYNAKVKGEAAVLNPNDPNYEDNTQRLEQQYEAVKAALEHSSATFEASIRAMKVKQQGITQPNVDELLKNYEAQKKQFEKQPILKGGTVGEVNVKSIPTTSYWYEAAHHTTANFNKLPEKTQQFLITIANQPKRDVLSGAILDAGSIKKVAPEDYIKAVKALKEEEAAAAKGREHKAEWFRKASLDKLAGAVNYQNKGQGLVEYGGLPLSVPIIQTVPTTSTSPKKEQEDKLNDLGDKLGKLSHYLTFLENDTANPNSKIEYKKVMSAYQKLYSEYEPLAKDFHGKLKQFPYYVPRNDVNIISKETGIPVGVFATLNSSVTGKIVNAIMLGNPDFRNYDPSGLKRTAQALGGLIVDGYLFWGLGELAGGLTDAAIKGMSRIKLTEGMATRINEFADVTAKYASEGIKPADAVAQAAIDLPKDALRIKAAITAMSAVKQGSVLSAYNILNEVMRDVNDVKNATQGSKVKYKGTLYTVFKSDGDNVRMIDANGNEKELTRAEYDKFVHAYYGNVLKPGAIGFVGGALMPEAKLLSESLMKAADINNALLNSGARIALQAYGYAAAGSLIKDKKLPSMKDFTSAVVFFAGMEAGTKVGAIFKGQNPFAKYFQGGQKNLNNEELLQNIVETEKVISKDNNFAKKVYGAVRSYGAGEDAKDVTEEVVNKDGHVVLADYKGEGVYITHGADVGKDGKVEVGKDKVVIVKPFDKKTGKLSGNEMVAKEDVKDLKVVSVQPKEEFQKELADRILKQGEEVKKPIEGAENVGEPSSKESGTTTPEEVKVSKTEFMGAEKEISAKKEEKSKEEEVKPVEKVKAETPIKEIAKQPAETKKVEPVTYEVTTAKNDYVKRGKDWHVVTYDREMNPYEEKVTKPSLKKYLNLNETPYTDEQYTPTNAETEAKPATKVEEPKKELSKAELRTQKFTEINNELGDELNKLATSLGIIKNLTGEKRDDVVKTIGKITKLLAEKLVLKGAELKDAVLEYLKFNKMPIDDDVKTIVQDHVDKLGAGKEKEPATPEEEPPKTTGETAGISNAAQEETAAKFKTDVPLRKSGLSTKDAINVGRIRYNAMTDPQKEKYFKDLRKELNKEDPLDISAKPIDLFISRARSVEMEGELNDLQHQMGEATGTKKRDIEKKLDDALDKWQKFEVEYINPLKNKWSKEGQGMQGREDIEDGTLTAMARKYAKVRKRPFTPEDRKHFSDIAYDISKLDKEATDKLRKFFLGNDAKAKKPIQQSLRDVADKLDKLKIHRPGVFAAATPASLAYDLGIDAVKLSLRGAATGIDIAEAIGEAVHNGINALKKTDWYKKLSDKDAEEIKSQFILSVNSGLEDEGFKSKDKKEIKKEVAGKNKFTAKEARDVWQYAKDNYINEHENGIWTDKEYQDAINAIGKDLGMKASDVEKAITDPKTERIITEEKQQLLDTQRKFMSTARRMKSIRELPDIRTAFAERKGKNFTFEERQRIWDYVKENYVGLGIDDMGQIVKGLASDLGITNEQALNIFAKSKTGRKMTNDVWDIYSRRRRVVQNANYEIDYKDSPLALKILRKIPRLFFSVKVLWHFGVGGMTHAGMYTFTPEDWGRYIKAFGKQYRLALSSKYYEKQMTLLKLKDDYLDWTKVGLGINPNEVYTDYELFGKFLDKSKAGSFIRHMNDMGTRGFGMLKLLRYDVAHQLYENASASAKSQFISAALGYSVEGNAKTKEVLRGEVANKELFTPSEANDIIEYTHANYMKDNQVLVLKKEYNNTINSVAKDLDLKPKVVESIITKPREDDVLRKEIALLVNHSTGASNIKFSKEHQSWDETLSAVAFAWRLEASRVARLTAEPGKALIWLGSKDPARRATSHILLRRIGEQIATYGSMLALNQAILTLVGSKQKVNVFDPDNYDWLMFQIPGGHTMDISGGVRGTLKFTTAMIGNFLNIIPRQIKAGKLVKRGDTMGSLLLNYLAGKSSPMAQFLLRWSTGYSYNGQELYRESAVSNKYQSKVPWYTLPMETVLPLPIEAMYNNYKEAVQRADEGIQRIGDGMTAQGIKEKDKRMLLGSILYGIVTGLSGIRIGTGPKEESVLQSVLEKNMVGTAAEKEASLLKAHKEYEAAIKMRQGANSKAKEGYKAGKFGINDIKKIQKESQADVVQDIQKASFKNLIDTYFNPKAKAFLDANPDYKRYMMWNIAMKRHNLLQKGRWYKRSQKDRDSYTPYLIKWGNEMKALSKEKK